MRFETPSGGVGDGQMSFSDTLQVNGDLGDDWLYTATHASLASPNGSSDNWFRATKTGSKLAFYNEGTQTGNQGNPAMWFPRRLLWFQGGKPAGLWGKSQFAQITWLSAAFNSRCGLALFGTNDDGALSRRQSYSYHCANAAGTGQVVKSLGNGSETGTTFTVLFSDGVALAANDVMRLEAKISGTSIILTAYKNGSQLYQTTDASPLLLAGLPVLVCYAALGSTGSTDQTYINFSCGPLAS